MLENGVFRIVPTVDTHADEIGRKRSYCRMDDAMYAEERRLYILELLKQKKRVDVADLATQMDISPETIRRDLREMESSGHLKRTHGGAIFVGDPEPGPEIPVLFRKAINYEEKARIARRAAAFIEDGDVIALDNSTTVFCLLKYIPKDYKITVLTNAIQVVLEIYSFTDCAWTCVSLGGVVRPKSCSTVGFLACNTLSFFRPNKFFMSCNGVDRDGQLTEGNISETEIKRAMIRCSQKRFLLMDESKWGQIGVVNEANISEMDYLITNASVDRAKIEFLRDKGVKILFDSMDEDAR